MRLRYKKDELKLYLELGKKESYGRASQQKIKQQETLNCTSPQKKTIKNVSRTSVRLYGTKIKTLEKDNLHIHSICHFMAMR